MTNVLRMIVATLLGVVVSASMANAQCAFEHPKRARGFRTSLTQAMLPCDSPNDSTEGGVPSCSPPETFNQLDGNPPDGWVWGPSSSGSLSLKAAKNKVVDPVLNPMPNTLDVVVRLNLNGVFDANGAVASAPGKLALLLRATIDDRVNGDMTQVDFPMTFDFMIQGNKGALKTSANARLNAMGLPGLPSCSSIEVLAIQVLDKNGAAFATPGVFLPEL